MRACACAGPILVGLTLLTAIGLGIGLGLAAWNRWFADKCYLSVTTEVSFRNADPHTPTAVTRIDVVRMPARASFPSAPQVGCPQ